MIDLKKLADLLYAARVLVEDHRSNPDIAAIAGSIKKAEVVQFFKEWDADRLADYSVEKETAEAAGRDTSQMDPFKPLTIEDQQAVLLIAATIHAEVYEATWKVHSLARNRTVDMTRIASQIGRKPQKRQKSGKPNSFDIEDAIATSLAKNVTVLGEWLKRRGSGDGSEDG